MKNSTVVLIIIILVAISGLAGYFVRYSIEQKKKPQTLIVREIDPRLKVANDSLNLKVKFYRLQIDSLKSLINNNHRNYEKDIKHIDSLPAPAIFREISEYYLR